MAYTIDYRTAGAELCFTDFVSGQELLDAKAEFFGHRFETAARYCLCDFTDASRFDIPSKDVDRLVEQDRAEIARHPHLLEVVIAPQNLVYGLARMWQSRVNMIRPHTAVVRQLDEAAEWLRAAGISPALEHCSKHAAEPAAAATRVRERV